MRYILTLLFASIFLTTIGQERISDKIGPQSLFEKLRIGFEPVDWDYIDDATIDIYNDTYYPNLYTKYITGDTTLTLSDYRLLYYGFSFQKNYNPLQNNPALEEALIYHSQIYETMTSDEILTLIDKCKRALTVQPFNIRTLNLISYCYLQLKDEYNTIVYSRMKNGVIEAILSSGSGVDKESPWSVIYRSDIIDLVAVLGGRFTIRMYITRDVEYFHLNDKIENIKGFYFDLSSILRVAKITEKGLNGFEFNPLYNPKSNDYMYESKNIKN